MGQNSGTSQSIIVTRYCVYIHRNKVNNKSYIGITSKNPKDRWGKDGYNYRKTQPVFYAAIKKYGWDNFEHIIWAENLNKVEATCMEIKLIAIFKTNCKKYKNPEYGYNMTDGGEGTLGRVHSDETRRIIGDKAKERYRHPEDNPMYGKCHSEETKRKMSKERQGQNTGEDNPFYGKHHTEESKQKMREYALNRPDGVKQKLSEQAKKRTGEKNPNYGKGTPVIQLTKDMHEVCEFSSAFRAQQMTGVDIASIRRCCKYEQKTAGGYKWMYADEYHKIKFNELKGE